MWIDIVCNFYFVKKYMYVPQAVHVYISCRLVLNKMKVEGTFKCININICGVFIKNNECTNSIIININYLDRYILKVPLKHSDIHDAAPPPSKSFFT